MSEFSLETNLVHAGERKGKPIGQPVATPLYATATYTYDSMAEMDAAFVGEGGDYIYSRYGNPTVAALEDALAAIEAGTVSVAYGSGMAAIHAALFACELTSSSIVLASQDLYGASFDLLNKIFGAFGVKMKTADFNDLDKLKMKTAELKPRVLLAETISNPLLKICDIAAVAEIAHENGARLVVDNYFRFALFVPAIDARRRFYGSFGDEILKRTRRRNGRNRRFTRRIRPCRTCRAFLKLVGGVFKRLGSASNFARRENSGFAIGKTMLERCRF